jgi:sensor domain CHASE-containing protein
MSTIRKGGRDVRRRPAILFAVAFASALLGAAACGAVEQEVQEQVDQEIQEGREQVEQEIQEERTQIEQEIEAGRTQIAEEIEGQ